MPRSLKKGPFVDDHLLKKVDAQNEKNSKQAVSYTHLTLPTTPYV